MTSTPLLLMLIFEHLLVLLTAIWISRKSFLWLKLPTLFGEVFAGFLVGPMMLGWVTETEAIRVLAELGIFFLMFHAGLEFSPDDLFTSLKGAFWIACGGILFSFVGVFGFSVWSGFDPLVSFFMALVLMVSSVEIVTRMFKDAKIPSAGISQTTITAALVTEVAVLIIFSVFLDVYQTRLFDMQHFFFLSLKIFGYFAVVMWFGRTCSHYLHRFLYKGNKGFTLSLIIALAFGVFAEFIGLHFIIGAFLAGLFLQKELIDIEMYDKLEDRVFGLSYSFLGPIFFASLAFHLDIMMLSVMPFVVVGFFVVAMGTKFLGSIVFPLLKGKGGLKSVLIGLAMNNRGAMSLILAAIGLEEGMISSEIFSILVLLSLTTTLLSLLLSKPLMNVIRHPTI